MSTVIEQAQHVVLEKEEKDLQGLFVWLSEAERKAEACGCPNCKKELRSVKKLVQKEYDRLLPQKNT